MKQWWKYIRPYLGYFILAPIFMMVEVVGEVIMPKLLAQVINSANAGTLTNGLSLIVMAKMVLTALLMMGGGVLGAYFSTKASVNFGADLRADAYSHIQDFAFSNIDRFSTGSLVTRLTNDVTQVQNFVNMMLRMAIRAPGMMVAALIMAIRINADLSVVFAVSIPLLLAVVGMIVKIGFPRFGALQAKVDGVNSRVQENVTNVRVVKSFVREDREIQRFRQANGELRDAGLQAMRVVIFMQPVMTLFMNATIIAVILIGGRIVLNLGMEVGDLSAFITYVSQILSSLLMVTIVLMLASRAMASARRIREVLEETPDIADAASAQANLQVRKGEVEFRNVTFRYYKTSPDAVLRHVSLQIPAGSVTGVIGSTGCGKSTLVSMIPRLYEPDEGDVLVDGVNVKNYTLENLRQGVGMVLQKNTLFSGTVADNLRWGDENADAEQLQTAAQAAQADRFVQTFEQGYDTMIQQGGSNVSGGQKQRLCIARALLKKPKILILDDSTSAVDTATEARIRQAFRKELKDATKIIIAQRISSVMDADQIVVMDDGAVVAVGTHAQLLETCHEYREIYDSQMSGEKEA